MSMTKIELMELPKNTTELLKLMEDRLGITNLIPSSSDEYKLSDVYLKTGTRQQGYFFLNLHPDGSRRIVTTLSVWVSKNNNEVFVHVNEQSRAIKPTLVFKKSD